MRINYYPGQKIIDLGVLYTFEVVEELLNLKEDEISKLPRHVS